MVTEQKLKPLLIFDGDCNFCRLWIARWKLVTKDHVDYAPSQEVGHLYPQIDAQKFEASVQLVEPDGQVYDGAEAVFRTLAHAPGNHWALKCYRTLPGFSWSAELVYRFVANHRVGFSRLTRWIWGSHLAVPTFFWTRRIFLSALGLIYCMAFLSLWAQIEGLVGSQGILPAEKWLEAVEKRLGDDGYWRAPTIFWLGIDDGLLKIMCLAGAALSLVVVAGYFPAIVLFLLWGLYLSFATICREFLGFQWDNLLLEVGFLAIFLAPFRIRPRLATEPYPSLIVIWLLRFVLFKVLFMSGLVKIKSGDATWANFTALNFHYETQPLPTWVGWYAHLLPEWFQQFSVGCVFFIQLAIPWLILGPGRIRTAAGLIMIGFQGLILITGNYAFFNLLTIALCLLLFEDRFFSRMLPDWMARRCPPDSFRRKESVLKRGMVALMGVFFLAYSVTAHLVPVVNKGIEIPQWVRTVSQKIGPFRSSNPYGLFAVMTTKRPEIIIQGSHDGFFWKEYEFKWKPGDLKQAPAFVAPHQPRLDWQMWFAALGDYRRNPWFLQFMTRLLQGSPAVEELLAYNPFPEGPPKYIRPQLYEYHFTNYEERNKDGSFWRREYKGIYTPVLKLPDRP